MSSPLYIDSSVVEKIADDIIMISNNEEERILHLSSFSIPNAESASPIRAMSSTTPFDEDDSPLLKRQDVEKDIFYGGERVVFSVIQPLRMAEGTHHETGYVLVTNYRFIFVPYGRVTELRGELSTEMLMDHLSRKLVYGIGCFPLAFVRSVKAKNHSVFGRDEGDKLGFFDVNVSNTTILIHLVDRPAVSFEISHTHLEKNKVKVEELLRLLNRAQTPAFAFAFRPERAYTFDGWNVYNFFREMNRMFQPVAGILVLDEDDPNSMPLIGSQAHEVRPSEWRVADVSDLCPSYPQRIAVPRLVTDQQLREIAAFRTRARVPALALLHPQSSAALVRCSQPKAGITQSRCLQDEFYFQEMTRRNPSENGMVIFDARPFLNAAWNRGVKGAGYESEETYNCKVSFLDIPNVHRVRESHAAYLSQFYEECANSVELENLMPASSDNSGETWLNTLSKLLDGSLKIAACLKSGVSVAVHCSDGWDRTPQLVSLAMVLSDPFFRTVLGFQVLIESQWVAFGHKFKSRHGGTGVLEDYSPIFVQFLDCTYQLLSQHPDQFEFNEQFLVRIAKESYAGRFGTFLSDSLQERTARIQHSTHSLWSDLTSKSSEVFAYRRHNTRFSTHMPQWATSEREAETEAPVPEQLEWRYHPSEMKVLRDLHLFFSK
jgi:myotubularin-related protein 1/2